MAQFEELLQADALVAQRMIGAQQADEAVIEQFLAVIAGGVEIGKVADRQIDLARRHRPRQLARRHRDRTQRRLRRQMAQAVEDAGQEHHLAHVRHREGELTHHLLRIEAVAGEDLGIDLGQHFARARRQRLSPRGRRHADSGLR